MAEAVVEQRVDRLDELMASLARQAARTERQVERTSREMVAFKAEGKRMNRQWGELANRLGTLAEDIVAPSVPRVLRKVVGTPRAPVDIAVRIVRHLPASPDTEREFDVVATCGDYLLVNETKSKLRIEDVREFVAGLPTVRNFFPEYAGKRVIGAIASLYVTPKVARFAEAQGLIVLGLGDDLMDVLNSPGFVPREF